METTTATAATPPVAEKKKPVVNLFYVWQDCDNKKITIIEDFGPNQKEVTTTLLDDKYLEILVRSLLDRGYRDLDKMNFSS